MILNVFNRKFLTEYIVYILFFSFIFSYFFILDSYFNLFNVFIILLFVQLICFFIFTTKKTSSKLHKYITDLSQCQFILSIIF